MTKFLTWLRSYPAGIQLVLTTAFNTGQVLGLYSLTPDQIAAINAFGVAVLSLIVHSSVTPNVRLPKS